MVQNELLQPSPSLVQLIKLSQTYQSLLQTSTATKLLRVSWEVPKHPASGVNEDAYDGNQDTRSILVTSNQAEITL